MQWFKVVKSPRPKKGKYYWDWKQQLSVEGRHQCVYCAIMEGPFGGPRNFHIEHYRPKSIKRFKNLEHNYNNLFYACSICNCFKGSDWPNTPNKKLNTRCYPNPSKINYSNIFRGTNDYDLRGKYFASRYMIEKLFLNRPQLKLERKAYSLTVQTEKTLNDIQIQIEKLKKLKKHSADPVKKTLIDAVLKLVRAGRFLNKGRYVIPYTIEQITK